MLNLIVFCVFQNGKKFLKGTHLIQCINFPKKVEDKNAFEPRFIKTKDVNLEEK